MGVRIHKRVVLVMQIRERVGKGRGKREEEKEENGPKERIGVGIWEREGKRGRDDERG